MIDRKPVHKVKLELRRQMLKKQYRYAVFYLERVKGIEPSFSAWEADVLPLNYTRLLLGFQRFYSQTV